MKISINYKANTTQVNMIPRVNPLILIFETVDGFTHCMTYHSAERAMKKEPIMLTVIRLKDMSWTKFFVPVTMSMFLVEWRNNYFNPDFIGGS